MRRILLLTASLALATLAPTASADYTGVCVPAGVVCYASSSEADTGCTQPCGGTRCYGVFLLEGGPNPAAGSTWDTYFVRCSGDPNCEEYFDMQSSLLGRREKTCDYQGPVPPPTPDPLCGESACIRRLVP